MYKVIRVCSIDKINNCVWWGKLGQQNGWGVRRVFQVGGEYVYVMRVKSRVVADYVIRERDRKYI